ncbi:MAG: dephospho-CoA kinase [Chloroflexi bacterium]|nr:dephospho-CoA kinase [Chloroflexota bacterium]
MVKLELKKGKLVYLIGLTGNIACGKSAVLELLAQRGAQVIDADRVVHRLMEPRGTIYGLVVEQFGEDILGETDTQGKRVIDRRKLGAIVFTDPLQLRRLEEISHPLVRVDLLRQIQEATASVVVLDAVKLIESGLASGCDALWVVTCQPEIQLERLMQRNNFSQEEALLRIQAQPPQAEKVALASVVIDNGGNLKETEQQVQDAWEKIG